MPKVTDWLVDYAVSTLPKEHRERYSEEWRNWILETPGDLGKVFAAISKVIASGRMAADWDCEDVHELARERIRECEQSCAEWREIAADFAAAEYRLESLKVGGSLSDDLRKFEQRLPIDRRRIEQGIEHDTALKAIFQRMLQTRSLRRHRKLLNLVSNELRQIKHDTQLYREKKASISHPKSNQDG